LTLTDFTSTLRATKARGKWIPGVIDPAAQGRTQSDGQQLIQLYRGCGLDLSPAVNAVEAGLYLVWQLMSAGKLKVFASLGNWLQEFRLYQRDSEGRVVKNFDHLMDAMRYLIVSGRVRMRSSQSFEPTFKRNYFDPRERSAAWMS
jgi:hypothetical protein